MNKIELVPGMRVRCVDAGARPRLLTLGAEYCVSRSNDWFVELEGLPGQRWFKERFKPIVRVKAPSRRVSCFNISACGADPEAIKRIQASCALSLGHIFAYAH